MIFQGKGYGSKILDFAESFASKAQLKTVSCRSDLLSIYAKRGYKEIRRYPVEQDLPSELLTRKGLEMIVFEKFVK